MREVETYNHWETLSIKKGYALLVKMGMGKREARIEAIKGVKVFTISPITKK
jgi:hypothetical protein